MNELETGAQVLDRNGLRGTVDSLTREADDENLQALVRFEDGRFALIRPETLQRQENGSYLLPIDLTDVASRHHRSDEETNVSATSRTEKLDAELVDSVLAETQELRVGQVEVIPIIAEQLRVAKQQLETGRVRIVKTVSEYEETVDEPLLQQEAEIERIPINRVVEAAPSVRQEGEMMIVPILEEVLVVEKRLMLREELRVSLRQKEIHQPQTVTLRRENVTVERIALPTNESMISDSESNAG